MRNPLVKISKAVLMTAAVLLVNPLEAQIKSYAGGNNQDWNNAAPTFDYATKLEQQWVQAASQATGLTNLDYFKFDAAATSYEVIAGGVKATLTTANTQALDQKYAFGSGTLYSFNRSYIIDFNGSLVNGFGFKNYGVNPETTLKVFDISSGASDRLIWSWGSDSRYTPGTMSVIVPSVPFLKTATQVTIPSANSQISRTTLCRNESDR